MAIPSVSSRHYDVVIAGARCAGASTAALLARGGLRVLIVDPLQRGRDTLSTHALMRGAVLQLHRWDVLDAIRDAGTPPIHVTTFHYGDESIEVPTKPRDGVDALYAPRRTVLDPILVDAAQVAGAEISHGTSVVELVRDKNQRVRGALLSGSDRDPVEVSADLVIGADGVRSRVAKLAGASIVHSVPNRATSVYGYWRGLGLEGNHWFYEIGGSVGAIPTNDGETCVFASVPPDRLTRKGLPGLERLLRRSLEQTSPWFAAKVEASEPSGTLRAWAGVPGFLRHSAGPGWALVGDAGYFRDPITAHGITDALRDAELLARAVLRGGGEEALVEYQATRDQLVTPLLELTDSLASFEWDLEEAKELHISLSREMKAEVAMILGLDGEAVPDKPEWRTEGARG